jgi:hypothetical protein
MRAAERSAVPTKINGPANETFLKWQSKREGRSGIVANRSARMASIVSSTMVIV